MAWAGCPVFDAWPESTGILKAAVWDVVVVVVDIPVVGGKVGFASDAAAVKALQSRQPTMHDCVVAMRAAHTLVGPKPPCPICTRHNASNTGIHIA